MPETDPIPAPEAPQEQPSPMLDVHSPHEPVHGLRDFLLHIFTITIGLLIALSLEAGVESLHHRHIVAEARENIRHEIELNHQALTGNTKAIHEDADRINTNLETIRRLRAHPKNFHGNLQFTMNWSSFNDSAWRSSRDMGALAYMPYAEVQGYADLYAQQEIVNKEAMTLFSRQSLAVTPMVMEANGDDIPPAETQIMLRDTAGISLSLNILSQIMQGLDNSYTEALKK
jgi:hypothetical protein